MKLIDLDQRVIVPVVDETHDGVTVEMEMSIGELLGKALEDFEPKIIEAVPVAWFDAQIAKAPDSLWASHVRGVRKVWQKEQEEKRNG